MEEEIYLTGRYWQWKKKFIYKNGWPFLIRQFWFHSAENWSLGGPPANPQLTSDWYSLHLYKFANKSLIIQLKNQVHLKPLLTISMLMVATTFAEQQWPHLSSAFVIPVIIQMATAASIWSRDLHALCFSLAVPRFFRRFWRYCASFWGLLRQPSPILDKVSVFSHQKLHFSTAIFQWPAKWSWRPPRNFELSQGSRPTACYSWLSECVHLVMMSLRSTF